jgi:hypothetical protein
MTSTATSIVVAHLVVSLIHGAAHSGAQVPLSAAQNVFVYIVILAGPIAALVLMRANRRLGATLLALTMGASLVFGIVFHFVLDTPDHVSHVTAGTWRLPFQSTAGLLAILEAAGVWAGIRTRSGQAGA